MARILLVDDDIAEIAAVQRALGPDGHGVTLSTSVDDARARAAGEPFDAAVVSAGCDGGGGATLAYELGASGVGPWVVVLGEAGEIPPGAAWLPRPVDTSRLREMFDVRFGAVGAPTVRLPFTAETGGSEAAAGAVRAERTAEALRTASAALRDRAEEIRRESTRPAGWLEPPHPSATSTAPAPEPLPAPPPELAAGTLAEAPAPTLLALAARAGLDGRIDFGGEHPRSVYFEAGRVVGATSPVPAERVDGVALRMGWLSPAQHRSVSAELAALPPRPAAMRLLEMGFITPEELPSLARRQAEEVVLALFDEPDAPFRYAPERVPPEVRATLERGTLALAVDGVRRRWLEPRLAPVLGGSGTLLSPVAGASTAGLGLSAAEAAVASLADGMRSLDEVLAASALPPLAARQVLAALVLVGVLSVRFRGGAAVPAERALREARLRQRLDQARHADYFAILGVDPGAAPAEVEAAASRLLAEIDAPGRGAPARWEAAARDEIRRVVGQARAVLCDPELGPAYAAARAGSADDAPATGSR